MTAVSVPVPATRRREMVDLRLRPVAWPAVLGLAVVMVYADVFLVVSLRQAAGAIERTSDPFTSWLRESTLLLPTYVVAVLCARAVAGRRQSARPGDRPWVATGLTLVGLGTVVGVLVLAASSVYDYRLEVALLEHTAHVGCSADCLESQRASTGALQLKSVGYGSAIMLVTNLVAVGWLAALTGGRLPLDRLKAARWARASTGVHRPDTLTALTAATLAGAAVVHAAVVPAHIALWPAAGAFFVMLACVQAGAAAAVLRRRRASSSWATIASSVPLAIWVWSRTAGLPWGPDAGQAEPLGLADSVVATLELATLVLIRRGARQRHPTGSDPPLVAEGTRIALVVLVAVIALGLGGSGIGWLDVTGGAGHGPSAGE